MFGQEVHEMKIVDFTKRIFTKAQSVPADFIDPLLGQVEDKLGGNQKQVTHFEWTITVFGYHSQLTYSLTKD